MFQVNNKDTRTMPRSGVLFVNFKYGVFIVNFKHTSHFVLVFLLLTLNMSLPAGGASTRCFVFFVFILFYIFLQLTGCQTAMALLQNCSSSFEIVEDF